MADRKYKNCYLVREAIISARSSLKELESLLASPDKRDIEVYRSLKNIILETIQEIKKYIYVIQTEETWINFFMEVREAQTREEAETFLESRVSIYRDLMETQINSPRNFNNVHFTTLPDNLIVPGNLILKKCYIQRLPKNLQVKEKLDLSVTKIYSGLPSGLICNELDLRSTGLDKLPDDLRAVMIYVDPLLMEEAKRLKAKNQITVINP